jgi:hypothetical protein
MNDVQLRGVLLKTFYDLRYSNGGRVPVSDINLSGYEIMNDQVVGSICRQLDGAGLIRWIQQTGKFSGIVQEVGEITALGIDVVQGNAMAPIAISFPSPTGDSKPTNQQANDNPLRDIPATRIANWERYGADAIEADLTNNNGITYVGGPPEAREQAWRWVRHVRAKELVRAPEIFALNRARLDSASISKLPTVRLALGGEAEENNINNGQYFFDSTKSLFSVAQFPICDVSTAPIHCCNSG